MGRFVEVNGKLTAIPGNYNLPVIAAGGARVAFAENSVVVCIGECTGGAKPDTVYELRSDKLIRSLFQSGPLYDMVRVQFDSGVAKVLAVRVGDQTQAEGSIQNGSSQDLLDLTSVDYGLEANKVSHDNEEATGGAFGRKLTLRKTGLSDEVFDNIGVTAPFAIRYKGNGSASTGALSRTALTTTVTGSSDGSVAFTYNFSSTTTVADVVAFVNAQNGYEAILLDSSKSSMLAQDLDFFAAVSILTETGTVSMDSATRTDFSSGSIAGLDDEDIVVLSKAGQTDEILYTVSGSTPEFQRGYAGTLPQIWSSASAVTYVACTSVVYDMLTKINSSSQRVTAIRDTAYNNGRPSSGGSFVFLTGGTSPAVTNADYQTALNTVRPEYYRFGVIDSTDAAVHQFVKTHAENRWGTDALYGTWDVGATKDEAKSIIIGRAKTLNLADITLHFRDIDYPNDQGVATNYAPWMLAALVAAQRASTRVNSPIGQPLVNRILPNVTAMDQGFTLGIDDIEDLLADGVCVSDYDSDRGLFKVIRDVTTYNTDDTRLDLISSQVRSVVGWVQYRLKKSINEFYIGKKAMASSDSLRGIIADTMDTIQRDDEAIVVGGKIENGQRVEIPSYNVLSVDVNGNVTDYSVEYTPVVAQEFAKGQSVIVQYQDTI